MESHSKPNKPNRREFLADSAGAMVAGAFASISTPAGVAADAVVERQASTAPSPVQRIIIDTDPGVDDALAILLALRSPEFKVEAITPVAGNVPLEFTLANALRLVEIAGRTDVPVAAGASHPLVRRLVTADYVHGNNGLGGVEFPQPKIKPVSETAVEIIRRLVRSSPGEISIVAVGPLTNVATALRSDPDLAGMIRSIVLMGGSLSGGNITPSAEFNFYVDPEAARIVFDAGVPLTMVGLDVTRQVLLTDEHINALGAGKNPSSQAAARIMRATMERMHKGRDVTVVAMHDPLTVANMIDPKILTLRDYYVEVETSGELSAGETVGYSYSPARKSAPLATAGVPPAASVAAFRPNAKVAVAVDPDRFFRLLLQRLAGSA
jgi:inosine-uridine nucleoside N-ribohydrolase